MKIEITICDEAGRPRPWRDIKRDVFNAIIAAGEEMFGSTLAACKRFGIGRRTFYRYCRPTPADQREQLHP